MDDKNIAYIKLPSIIIKKDDLVDILDLYDKLTIIKSHNKFRDKTVVRIDRYITFLLVDYKNIIDICNGFGYHGFSSYNPGMIGYKSLIKMFELEIKHDFKVPISNEIREIINQIYDSRIED